MPGVREYVTQAKRRRLKLGVASSSSRAWVSGWLAHHSLLDAFDCVKCQEDVVTAKPDPALYVEAVRALGVLPHEAIALEDSLNGTRAARQAGLFCVAVPHPLLDGEPFDQAHLRLGSLPEMPLDQVIRQAGRWAASQARAGTQE
jgi:beta-phosphoglucomutase-like phosphatase (HAD superfamily)